MNKTLTKEELNEYLEELLYWGAVELQIQKDDKGMKQVFIPYVMNDAVECYVHLKECLVQGEWNPADPVLSADVVREDLQGRFRCGVILRQSVNIVTIWYRDAVKELHPYQYHLIGHNWRSKRETGISEEWRRVINLLCVLHDKYHYLGEEAVCEEEKKLRILIEFAPFCYYTPIDESILGWYPETEEGMNAAETFALEAGDEVYAQKIVRYKEQISRVSGKKREKLITGMAKELLRSEHQRILNLMLQKLGAASLNWEKRHYEADQESENRTMREDYVRRFMQNGYSGEYPWLRKSTGEWVHFVEEHPFTVLEAEAYEFRIYTIMGQ